MKPVLSTFALGMIALVLASPASAQTIKMLQAEVVALQGQVTTLQGQNTGLQTQVTALKNAINSTDAQNAFALGQFVTIDTTDTINGLAAPHIIFTGANLHIVSGSGNTVDSTGLGNLVIGYDEDSLGPSAIDGNRTGSHNLVVGPQHEFTASGGVVSGYGNFTSADYASVSGGECNTAGPAGFSFLCLLTAGSSDAASVSGGWLNAARGAVSSVSGGQSNAAKGATSSVSGGGNNTAGADASSVSGGFKNVASGGSSSVSGGSFNTASNTNASVSGGDVNTASGEGSSVGGGTGQTASGTEQSIN